MPPPLILHIDDSPDLPAGVAEALEEDGFELRHTVDPEEAMRLVEERSPALVLMDMELTACEGPDLMAGIRNPSCGSVPVLVVTNVPRDSALHGEAIALGVVDFLTKPVSGAALLEAIRETAPPPGGTAPGAAPAAGDLSGDLSETPMPELLARLRRRGANGLLAVRHGKIRVGVQLRNGSPIGVSSSRRAPLAEAVLYETFRWEKGRFAFSEGGCLEPEAMLELEGDPAGLLLTGVLDASPPRQVRERLAKRESLYVSITGESESALEAEGVRFTRSQRKLLEGLGGEDTLSVLLDSDAFDERLVYALWVAGWLELQTAPTLTLTELLGDIVEEEPERGVPAPRRDEHERELKELRQARAERERELAELAQTREEQKQELEQLARARAERLRELEELERARDEREREHEALAPALEERAQELEELGRARAVRARELQTLARAREEHEQELAELVRAREEREREHEALAPALEERARELEELTKARAERAREVEALARVREEHEQELEELARAREEQVRELAALAPALEERSRELEALERAREELAREVAALARVREEHERELEELARERQQRTQEPEGAAPSLHGPEPVKEPTPARPEPAAKSPAAVQTGPPPQPIDTAPAEPEPRHGEIALFDAPKQEGDPGIAESLRALAKRVLAGDDFQALGIAPIASDAEVRAAYEAILQEIPEIESTTANLVHTQQAKRIRSRIEAAYANLGSEEKRRAYSLLREEEEQDRKAKPSAERALEGERWFRKGKSHLEQKHCDAAIEAFGMAAHLDPEQGEYASHLGYALFLSNPKDDVVQREAMEHLAAGIKRSPKHELSYLYLGRILKAKGDVEVAKKIFKKALRIKPDFHPAVQELRVLEMRERSGKGMLSRLIGR